MRRRETGAKWRKKGRARRQGERSEHVGVRNIETKRGRQTKTEG